MAAIHPCIFAVAAALVFAFPVPVIAGLSWEDSWSAQSTDGRYSLVMIQANPESANSANKEAAELEKEYSRSGIYIRGESKDTLYWELHYQPPVFDAYISCDGEHLLLAVPAGHTSSNVSPWGELHFFHRNGSPQHWFENELTWGFAIKELLYIYPRRSFSEWTDAAFDPAANAFTVKTNRAEEFMFDVTTGRKIHSRSIWDRGSLVLLLIIPIAIVVSRRLAGRAPRVSESAPRWRLSVAEALLLITVVALLLALARFSVVIAIVVLLVGFGGGAVAQIVARGRRAWWLGGIGAVYGSFVGLVFFSLLVEPILWRIPHVRGDYFLFTMFVLFLFGGAIGALVGGRLAKMSRRVDNDSSVVA